MSPCGGCVVTTNCMKCGNFFSLSFVVISKSSNSTSMLYTALALLSVSIHDTTLSFLLITAMTWPCRYSSHMSLFGGTIQALAIQASHLANHIYQPDR